MVAVRVKESSPFPIDSMNPRNKIMNWKAKTSQRSSLCARSFERQISINNDPFKSNQKDLRVTLYLFFKAAPSQRKNDMLGMQ